MWLLSWVSGARQWMLVPSKAPNPACCCILKKAAFLCAPAPVSETRETFIWNTQLHTSLGAYLSLLSSLAEALVPQAQQATRQSESGGPAMLYIRWLRCQPHVGAVGPHLGQLLAVPPPAEHVVAGREPTGHAHTVQDAPRLPAGEAVAAA